MPRKTIYHEFLSNPPASLTRHPHFDEMRETVAFMLKHGLGLANAVPTREILEHLQGLDFDISTTTWQIQVLGPLREAGVFIGSARGKVGMFLLDSRADATAARSAQQQRIAVEQRRLNKLTRLIRDQGW